jgi:ATP-dependent HslUV protease ATP-binding subunit HslU
MALDTAATEAPVILDDLTPREIVSELDKHVVGQKAAKRAVAIALRNRWRRQQLEPSLAEEVAPKNILMIGPTGVGKTEIARRLARLARAPFLKVEASKFTEVGYIGRDVESMVRDLVDIAVAMVRDETREAVRESAAQHAEARLLDLLLPPTSPITGFRSPLSGLTSFDEDDEDEDEPKKEANSATRDKLRAKLERGELDHREVEVEVEESNVPSFEMFTPQGVEEVGVNIKEMMPGLFGRRKRQRVKVPEAREILRQQEADKLVDRQQIGREARRRVEQGGIIFLDEIDKVAGRETGGRADPSHQGVQRDLLPIVEGTTVNTKYGMVKTDHVLFIAAGAFHVSKPSDLIPELQGRFPIRVELNALTQEDLVRILTEPKAALTKQYSALLATEGVTVEFGADAVAELARLAVEVNSVNENIGARRLSTLLERLLDEVSFEAPDMDGVTVQVDAAYVTRTLADIVQDQDLSKYVL